MKGSNFVDDLVKGAAKGLNDFGNFTKNLDGISFHHVADGVKSTTTLQANNAINDVYEFFMGASNSGIRGTLNNLADGQGFGQAVKGAYTAADGKGLNYKAIAGTYIGGSLVGRAATGGGIYRDQTGNINMPGVPFI